MTRQDGCHDERLTLYFYNELTDEQQTELEQHLQGCPACRTALAQIETSVTALPVPELALTSIQKQRFVIKVTNSTRRRSIHSIAPWGGGLAAAGVLAAVLLLLLPADEKRLISPEVPARPAMADFEILEQLELLQDLDLLQQLELLQELERLG